MRKTLFATLLVILSLCVFSACSNDDDLIAPKTTHITVLFPPESLCNIGYNDMTLKAIETYSQKYGYDYLFCVPESIEEGMNYYEYWRESEVDDNISKALFVFASALYEEPLAKAIHPTSDPQKDLLIFEVAKVLPYAYTFAMTYYGASYMIGSFYLNYAPIDIRIIAANPHVYGLDEIVNGFSAAIEDKTSGTIEVEYLSQSPEGGFDDDDDAFIECKLASQDADGRAQLFVPYAGVSNLGVYRFSQSNHEVAVGVDCIDPNSFSYIFLSMNKRVDLALDDFLELWINDGNPPRHRFYSLESGRVVVDRASILNSNSEEIDNLFIQAVAKEKEYFKKQGVDEIYL